MSETKSPTWEPLPDHIKAWLSEHGLEVIHRDNMLGRVKMVDAMAERINKQTARIAELEVTVEVMIDGLNAVDKLIESSEGVCGLHDNGDPTPWEELLPSGAFDAWLVEFETAIAAARKEAK